MRVTGNRRRRRRNRRRTGDDSDQPGINLLALLIVALVLAIIPFFLKDVQGNSYGPVGSYFWLMSFGMGLFVGIYYFAQYFLPLSWFFSWYEGSRLTIRHNFHFLVIISRNLRLRPKIPGATPEAEKDLPSSFGRHKAGIIRSHQAPVIFKGAAFIRGAEPGFLRLKPGQLVVQVIDLRRQLRRLPVEVLTRDGITLETSVTTIMQVKEMENPPDDDWQFPFDQEAIFKVNYLGNFKTENDEVMHWTDRVPRQAASALIGEVSRYSLDELFELDESRASPLEKIKGKLLKKLQKAFEKYGIEINFLGVSPFVVPEDIQEERVAIWKETWQQRIDVEAGTAEAERGRRLKLARARAQIEMIEQLTDGLETIRQTGQDVTDILSLRLIEAIEEAESNASIRALIPAQIANDLKSIRSQVLGTDD